MNLMNFLARLAMFTAVVLMCLGGIYIWPFEQHNYPFLFLTTGLVALLSSALYLVCLKTLTSGDSTQVGNVFTLATGVKMGATLVFYLAYQHFVSTLSRIDVLIFFAIYAVFIVLELVVLVKMVAEK